MTDAKDIMSRGKTLLKMGDIAGAFDLFKKAVSRCEESGDSTGQVEPLQLLSKIYELNKETGKAIETNERLLALYKATADHVGQGRVLNNLGLQKARAERYVDAIQSFQTALDIFEVQGNSQRVADQHANIGSVYRDMNKHEAALVSYDYALELFERLDQPEGVADQLTNIAYIHLMADRLEKALPCYRRALPLYIQAGAERKADATRQNLENLEKSTR